MANDNAGTIDPLFKLRNSPLQGAEAYRSPFYRRLLSAGYKGYVQGSLGGATLFGLFGAVLGLGAAAVAMPFLGAATATSALIAVPIAATGGMLYGAHTFSTIGAVAAISAEQAEMSEKRRNLLDRYYETPSSEEAKEIERQLASQGEEKAPQHWYHWKTGLLGAAVVGGAIVLALAITMASGPIGGELFAHMINTPFMTALADATGLQMVGETVVPTLKAFTIFGGIGALAGGIVGIDRAYIRKWFDNQEGLHEDGSSKSQEREHIMQLERLRQAYRAEGYGLQSRSAIAEKALAQEPSIQPIAPEELPAQGRPGTITTVASQEDKRQTSRLIEPQQHLVAL